MAFPATFVDIQNIVIAKLRLDAVADLQRVKDAINEVYAQVCVETEALETSATMAMTANVASYTLPIQILRVKEMVAAPASAPTSYGAPLEDVSLDEINLLRQTAAAAPSNNGTSAKYALIGLNQLEFWPTPANADQLLIYYAYLPTALSANTDVPVLQEPFASKLLEYGALIECAPIVQDPNVNYYEQKYDDWMKRFRRHLNRRGGGPVQQLRVDHVPVLSVGRDIDTGD